MKQQPSAMRSACALLLTFAALTSAAAQQIQIPLPGATGSWQFYCKNGKVVLVQIIVLVPGEFRLTVPPDACPKPQAPAKPPPPAPAKPPGSST